MLCQYTAWLCIQHTLLEDAMDFLKFIFERGCLFFLNLVSDKQLL